jgi:hypothetical protein
MRAVPDAAVRPLHAFLAFLSVRVFLAVLYGAGVACGGPPDDVPHSAAAEAALQAEAVSSGGSAHVLPLGQGAPLQGSASPHLSYYGGRVIENAEVVAVFWGEGVPGEVKAGMGDFYEAALKSSYVDWLSEYDTNVSAVDGSRGTGQRIGRGGLKQAVVVHPKAHQGVLTDAAIRRELTAQISARKLPAPGPNTLYMVHFPAGVQIELQGSRSCEAGGFCAYHNSFRRRGKELDYGVLPDLGPGSGCDTGCGRGATVFDNQTAVASHELIEAITDPQVGLAKGLGPPLAWYDAAGGEIGDICNAQQGRLRAASGRSYAVQKEWSNKAKACVVSRKPGQEAWAAQEEPAARP